MDGLGSGPLMFRVAGFRREGPVPSVLLRLTWTLNNLPFWGLVYKEIIIRNPTRIGSAGYYHGH